MIGGLKKSTSSLAILAAAGLFAGGLAFSSTSARAADLGGDCCADLEERVAELEATTVRHGNRKVSMTISGQVNSALLWYDNGEESDVYVIDNSESATRMNIKGKGTISPGVTAGYQIEFDIKVSAAGGAVSENDADDGGNGVSLRRAEVYIKWANLGRVTLGQGSSAADGVVETSFVGASALAGVGYGISVGNTGGFTVYDTISGGYVIGGGAFTNPSPRVTWGAIGTDLDTGRTNRVRYDSPTIAGFTFSASWGEDDYWDAAVRYANEWNGIRFAAAAGYTWDADDNGGVDGGNSTTVFGFGSQCNITNPPSGNGQPGDGPGCFEQERWGVSAAIMHVPSGLWVAGGYSQIDYGVDEAWADVGVSVQNNFLSSPWFSLAAFDDTGTHWWVAGGIKFRMNSLGQSEITAQYNENDNVGNINFANPLLFGSTISGHGFGGFDYNSWGVAFGQNIDAIGGQLYIGYIHHEAEYNDVALSNFAAAVAGGFAVTETQIDASLDQVVAGMRIKY